MAVLRVASLQLEVPDGETKAQRLERVEKLILDLPDVDLVLLPEIWNVGYFNFDAYADGAEPLDGPTMTRMSEVARRKRIYLLAGSFVERDGDGLYNTSVFFGRDGKRLATYRKIHLFGYGSAETRLLRRGDRVVTVPTEFGTVGLSTCYDLRFPELYRAQVDAGAEFFLVSSAWPFPRLGHWVTLNQARAVENEAFLISCNCAGMNQGRQYLGHSMVVDPWGTVVASAGDRPTVLRAEIDPALVRAVRAEFPPLADRVLGRTSGS